MVRTIILDAMELVEVAAGWFWMGWDEGHPGERPRHRIWVDEFAIARWPVTNAEYGPYLATTGAAPPPWWHDPRFDQPAQPVVGVNWFEAVAFCAWLSAEHTTMFRLPFEAEWEKAARGEDGRIFPWGNQPAGLSRANFGRTGLSGPVRDRPERLLLYPPLISVDRYENAVSPYGLYQTIGNVAEWVADWYDQDYYKTAPDRNPKGPETGTQKAFRGGGWMDSTTTMRVAMRNGTDPNTKINWLGFRCARSVSDSYN